jgi:uncharacterized membrane protein
MYVSSHTGEVVLDAPHVQQRWNYVGAWLHWLYFLRMQSVDPVWTWVVIVLSALCTVAAISGIVVVCGAGASVGTTAPARRRRMSNRGCAGTT